MNKILTLCALAAATLLSGCATSDPAAASETASQLEYPTGSNIPRKRAPNDTDGVSVYDKEALERVHSGQHQAPRPGLGGTP